MEVIFLKHTSSNDRRMLALFEKKEIHERKDPCTYKADVTEFVDHATSPMKKICCYGSIPCRLTLCLLSIVGGLCWQCEARSVPTSWPGPLGSHTREATPVLPWVIKEKKITHSLRVSVQTIVFTLTGLHLLLIPGVSSSFWYPLPSPL